MLRYTGGGFIPDVPARDLTEEEAERFGGAEQLARSGCYMPEPGDRGQESEGRSQMTRRRAAQIGPSETKREEG